MDREGEVNGAVKPETERKARTTLADLIAEHHGALEVETPERGVRRESSPGSVDVDTKTAEQSGRTATSTSVILFGRTGSGKSTLAQMLTLGTLDPDCKDLAASSGIRGETKTVKLGHGRDWSVLDTPGFGEPKEQLSTISSDEAEKKIKKYLQLMEGTYTHFLYVVMRDRIDELDKRLWKFFVRLCGDSIKTNFSVVISNASRVWLDKNRADLESSFEGCQSFLNAELPTIMSDDKEWETELQEVRMESLKQLEEQLNLLERQPVKCDFDEGFWKMNSKHITSSGASFRRMVKRTVDAGVSGVVKTILQINCVSMLLQQGDKFLVPQVSGGPIKATS